MTYGLPARGQADWDDELNNSVEWLRQRAQTAEADAYAARSAANYARERADALMGYVRSNEVLPPAPLGPDPADEGTFIITNYAFVAEDPNDEGTFLIGAPA